MNSIATNAYGEEFEDIQNEHGFKGQQWFGKRKELVEKYSWAVPSVEALRYLSSFEHLIEIGAGNGYWAACIEDSGGNVTAVEPEPPEDVYKLIEMRHASDIDVEGEAVLMVWPPHATGCGMAAEVASEKPSHVVYVGEPRGGCTASDEFFDLLDTHYGLIKEIDIPSYKGVNDNLYHYALKR